MNPTACQWHQNLMQCRSKFDDQYHGDLLNGFRNLMESGCLELLTCPATHPFLPLYQHQPEIIHAQLGLGLDQHQIWSGNRPGGIWLPECGFYPGLDNLLVQEGVQYTVLDHHACGHTGPGHAMATASGPLYLSVRFADIHS